VPIELNHRDAQLHHLFAIKKETRRREGGAFLVTRAVAASL